MDLDPAEEEGMIRCPNCGHVVVDRISWGVVVLIVFGIFGAAVAFGGVIMFFLWLFGGTNV